MKNQFLDPETPEEAVMLDKAWLQVEELFFAARHKAPAAGFAYRWQARWLQAERRQERVRKQWEWAANLMAVGLLVAVLTIGALAALGQPFFSAVFSGLVSLFASLITFMRVNLTVLAAIPLSAWLAFSAGCGLLLAAWTIMFRRAVVSKE